mgnify:CR=1 FL=1
MLDIKFLRDNPEIVKDNLRKKFQDHKLPLVDEVIELDKKNREIKQNGDELDELYASLKKEDKKRNIALIINGNIYIFFEV